SFNDKAQRRVLKKTTNIQHSENLIRTGKSNVSKESIGVSDIEIHETQVQTSQDQIMDNQNKTYKNKPSICGKDGHCKSTCPNKK
ncbi:22375_t:CDS:2, partial [Racocetra persica]